MKSSTPYYFLFITSTLRRFQNLPKRMFPQITRNIEWYTVPQQKKTEIFHFAAAARLLYPDTGKTFPSMNLNVILFHWTTSTVLHASLTIGTIMMHFPAAFQKYHKSTNEKVRKQMRCTIGSFQQGNTTHKLCVKNHVQTTHTAVIPRESPSLSLPVHCPISLNKAFLKANSLSIATFTTKMP